MLKASCVVTKCLSGLVGVVQFMLGCKDLTLTRVRRLAATSSTSTTCKKFARIGSSGKHQNNMYRDLMRLLKRQGCVEPMYIKIPMKTRAGLVKEVLWPCLPPREMFEQIVSRGLLEKVLTGGIDLPAFWDRLCQDPTYALIGVLIDHAKEKSSAPHIPARLHGDEGRYYNQRSIMVLSVASVAHDLDVYKTRALITVVPSTRYVVQKKVVEAFNRRNGVRVKKRKGKVNLTLKALCDFITWSFDVMSTGLWPEEPFVQSSVIVFRPLSVASQKASLVTSVMFVLVFEFVGACCA